MIGVLMTPHNICAELGRAGLKAPLFSDVHVCIGEYAKDEAWSLQRQYHDSLWVEVDVQFINIEHYEVGIRPTNNGVLGILGYAMNTAYDVKDHCEIAWERTEQYWRTQVWSGRHAAKRQLARLKLFETHPDTERIRELIGMEMAAKRLAS